MFCSVIPPFPLFGYINKEPFHWRISYYMQMLNLAKFVDCGIKVSSEFQTAKVYM